VVDVTVGERRLLRLDLMVGRTVVAAAAPGATSAAADGRAATGTAPVGAAPAGAPSPGAVAESAAPVGRASLVGVVRDSTGRVVPNAVVALAEEVLRRGADSAGVRTDAAGRFRLVGLPEGTHGVEVSALGYVPVRHVVQLAAAGPTELEVVLRRAQLLATVNVRAEAARRFQDDLVERKRVGFGTVRTQAEIAQYPQIEAALRTIPNLTVTATRGNVFALRMDRVATLGGNGCTPQVFIDGMLQNYENGSGSVGDATMQLAMLAPRDVAGIEVYQDPNRAPLRYRTQLNMCGVVLVWTRWYAEAQGPAAASGGTPTGGKR
jgi:hypothetical protein